MLRPGYIIYIIVAVVLSLTACSQYDTDVVGEGFVPLGGIVGPYTHQVYVEVQNDHVNVWGPYAHEVEAERDGARVTLTTTRDSLVIFCYGNASHLSASSHATGSQGSDPRPNTPPSASDPGPDGQIHIRSDRSFALYLGGLYLRSMSGPALWCECPETCYLVVTEKSQNRFIAYNYSPAPRADACLLFDTELVLVGTGSLIVEDYGVPSASAPSGALRVMDNLLCGYNVKATLRSESGDALHVGGDRLMIADGLWQLYAGRHGIRTDEADIHLTGGTLTGTALGQFVSAPGRRGLMPSGATCLAASADESSVSRECEQYVWQERVDTLALEPDSLVTYSRVASGKTTRIGTLRPGQSLRQPWVLCSSPALVETDTLFVGQK